MTSIFFEDRGERREVEPTSIIPGKEMYENGVVVERSPSREVFDLPGYTVTADESGRLVARRR